jgi:long-subunit acyl-CoA synthetase (AMP-forming)
LSAAFSSFFSAGVADFSTSVVPEGVVRSLKHRGLAAPAGALRDAAGLNAGRLIFGRVHHALGPRIEAAGIAASPLMACALQSLAPTPPTRRLR